jgi:hypothetical protein
LKLAKSSSNHEEIAREEEKMERNWRNGEGEPRATFCVSFRWEKKRKSEWGEWVVLSQREKIRDLCRIFENTPQT